MITIGELTRAFKIASDARSENADISSVVQDIDREFLTAWINLYLNL